MNIIKTSAPDLDKAALYGLTKSPAVMRMRDVKEGEEITVSAWAIYEEPDKKDPEKVNRILSVLDATTGCAYATNSPTFQRSFEDIVEIFGNNGFAIAVMHGTSNNGRNFIEAVFTREVQ